MVNLFRELFKVKNNIVMIKYLDIVLTNNDLLFLEAFSDDLDFTIINKKATKERIIELKNLTEILNTQW